MRRRCAWAERLSDDGGTCVAASLVAGLVHVAAAPVIDSRFPAVACVGCRWFLGSVSLRVLGHRRWSVVYRHLPFLCAVVRRTGVVCPGWLRHHATCRVQSVAVGSALGRRGVGPSSAGPAQRSVGRYARRGGGHGTGQRGRVCVGGLFGRLRKCHGAVGTKRRLCLRLSSSHTIRSRLR